VRAPRAAHAVAPPATRFPVRDRCGAARRTRRQRWIPRSIAAGRADSRRPVPASRDRFPHAAQTPRHDRLSAAPLAAKSASLNVEPQTLTEGQTAKITYSNPAKAGQNVLIEIDNGRRRDTVTVFVEMTLDATGSGTVMWLVPDWQLAKFNAPGATEIWRPIASS
jgi:hypothetical protein